MKGRGPIEAGLQFLKVKRKPPTWLCQHTDNRGALIKTVLRKQPPGRRGWDVLLPNGGIHSFKTRREALSFISRLRRIEEEPDSV